MISSKIHIVALPYYEVGGCLGEFLAQAQGRAMTLRPDPANAFDPYAICAYDWQGRHVGYVSNHDVGDTWRTLRGSGRKSLRGRVVEVNSQHHCLLFECHVETLGEVGDLYPTASYLEWTYTGPVLKATQELVTLEYMMDEISERLDEFEGWSQEERCEMSDYRRRLCLRLMEIDDSGFRELTEELKMAFGRTGREVHGGEVLSYWMRIITEPKTIRPLLACRNDYDADKVHRELEAFPESMFEQWLEDKDHFVAKLLYMHIPRKVLWQLVSGIAFYEAVKRREKSVNMVAADNVSAQQNVNLHFELFSNRETNIDKNYGPNIEHHGGTLALPNKILE